jgi:hypothetical protein
MRRDAPMSWKDVDEAVLARVVAELPSEFDTWAVSRDPRVRDAHPELKDHPNYHAFIGKALSMQRGGGVLPPLRKAGRRDGAQLWEKEAASPHVPVDVGPQRGNTNSFIRAQRLSQSLYRRDVLGVPCGTGPTRKATQDLGSMLRSADGERGLNFLDDTIREVAEARIEFGRGVEPFRVRNNLLSSQPMCFNLFGPLAADFDLARVAVSAIIDPVDEVTDVIVEHAPRPKREYLDDATSFDAFIAYRRGGTYGFIAIETKYTKPFSPSSKDGPAYRRWAYPTIWPPSVIDQMTTPRFNQLWRNHLLAIALRDHPGSEFAEAHSIVVHHPEDESCAEATEAYIALLAKADTVARWPLDRLLAAWEAALPGGRAAWLARFRDRYLVTRSL